MSVLFGAMPYHHGDRISHEPKYTGDYDSGGAPAEIGNQNGDRGNHNATTQTRS
jgi:hypothetical protein